MDSSSHLLLGASLEMTRPQVKGAPQYLRPMTFCSRFSTQGINQCFYLSIHAFTNGLKNTERGSLSGSTAALHFHRRGARILFPL